MRLLGLLLVAWNLGAIEVKYFPTAGHGNAGTIPARSNFVITLPTCEAFRGFTSPLSFGADCYLTNFNLPQVANIITLTLHMDAKGWNMIGSFTGDPPMFEQGNIQVAAGAGLVNGLGGLNDQINIGFDNTLTGEQDIVGFTFTWTAPDIFIINNAAGMEVATTFINTTRANVNGGSPPGPPTACTTGDFTNGQYGCSIITPFFSVTLNMAINCGPTTTGSVGVPFSDTFPVTGGTGPFTFALIGGSLPIGTSLNTTTGVVSGTPTVPATYTFTIQVTDSSVPTNFVDTVSCAIVISGTAPPLSGILQNYIMSDNPNFLEKSNFIHSN